MHFAWDKTKNKANQQKHGISFELAKEVFDDPFCLVGLDNHSSEYSEERYLALGCVDGLLVVLIVYALRSDKHGNEITRIISARKATKKEREVYFGNRK